MLVKSKLRVILCQTDNRHLVSFNKNKIYFVLRKRLVGETRTIYTLLTELGQIFYAEFSNDDNFFQHFVELK